MNVVPQAEQKMLAAGYNKEYLPIEGLDGFRKATVQLLLGADHPAIKDNRVAVVQVRLVKMDNWKGTEVAVLYG
jgi:aspartate aminotransferase